MVSETSTRLKLPLILHSLTTISPLTATTATITQPKKMCSIPFNSSPRNRTVTYSCHITPNALIFLYTEVIHSIPQNRQCVYPGQGGFYD